MLDFLTLQTISSHPAVTTVIYTMLVAFLLSVLVGITYVKTFIGLSYSRTYVQSLMLSAIVSATVMHSIGDSLARGLGMLGALAIIRFRTNFKDPKDILYMFAALAAGIGCGVGAYTAAVVGTLGFIFTAILLFWSPLGQSNHYDGLLRFNIENNDTRKGELESILKSHCRTFALVTLRDMQQGGRLDYAYHVKLKKPQQSDSLINTLPKRIPSIKGVHLMLQEATIEL